MGLTARRRASIPATAPDSVVRVYPVPAKDRVTISGIEGKTAIGVYDVAGREVMMVEKLDVERGTVMEVDVSGLGSGMYFVKGWSGKGGWVKKIIISR